MVGKTNAVTSNKAYAYIKVTYSSGLACSATNGVINISAPDTSGTYVFNIPTPATSPETWTINATDGTTSKSQTVSISSQYQIETVSLI